MAAVLSVARSKTIPGRSASAVAMMDSLVTRAGPTRAGPAARVPADADAALTRLLRRMCHKSDFSTLSSTIASINNLLWSEGGSTGALADSIIRDVSLTSKLLRMVNTSYFQQFGGAISTVSRAVSVLGVQKVRDVALSLTLFEHLENRAQADHLRDQATAAYFSGFMARELVARMDVANGEEAFVCGMFHRLGHLMAVFYLHDEAGAVARLATARGIAEDDAAVEVIGLSYTDLGMGVAREWKLPERIVASMRAVDGADPGDDEHSPLGTLSALSNRLTDVVAAQDPQARAGLMRSIESDYGDALALDKAVLDALLSAGAAAFFDEAQSLGMAPDASRFMCQVHAWLMAGDLGVTSTAPGEPEATSTSGDDAPTVAETPLHAVPGTPPEAADDLLEIATADIGANAAARARMLTAGIADITATLAGEYQLNDVLRIILETMYRAIGFSRVMLCTRDTQTNSLRARLGFGAGVDTLIKRGFLVPLEPTKDVFWAAIGNDADICIEDRDAEKVRAYVPAWYRNLVTARGLALFPVTVNRKPVALIYADHDEPGRLRFGADELGLLKTLRNQAALAVRQKYGG